MFIGPGLYHAGQEVYLLTIAGFERGDSIPGDVMIFVGPRDSIEDQLGKMKVGASKTKLSESPGRN